MSRGAEHRKVIQPPLWKRVGLWLGLVLVLSAGSRLWRGQDGVWLALDVVVFVIGITMMFAGWRQGVEVSAVGIRLRRLARRRQFSWDEIAEFESKGNVVLRDGSRVALLDWNAGASDMASCLHQEAARLGHPLEGDASPA